MTEDETTTRPTRRTLLKAIGATGFGGALAVGGYEMAMKPGQSQGGWTTSTGTHHSTSDHPTTTPIKHVVIIFQENVSFDHYFGTYPEARNPPGVPQFHAKPDTPPVNGLTQSLRESNPNAYNPRRLSRKHAVTADMEHGYTAEQRAFNHGQMDTFVQNTEGSTWDPLQYSPNGLVMDYYDGNTVTALWNYAQHFALNDNSFGTVTGPSTPGALNLISGQTHGGYWVDASGTKLGNPGRKQNVGTLAAVNSNGIGTIINDADPAWDERGSNPGLAMTGRNIGDLLNDADVSWGWFQGGFRHNGIHLNVADLPSHDYSAHHAAFQYYESTANPTHRRPASLDEFGYDGQANHQYGLTDFFTVLHHNRLPAVNFLKAARYQDGHAGYSDPLDEQHFLVKTINAIQKTPYWDSTAIIIAYDDSDGWYDHVFPPAVNPSQTRYDVLTGDGEFGSNRPLGGYQGRYGYGPRLPLLVISPYSRVNAIDSTRTDQSSILRFVEDNWKTGRIGDASFDELAGSIENMFDFETPRAEQLFLDPQTGQPIHGHTRTSH
ncbi:alkaline phosphatase family protein [Haladaptatus sp. AB643]|uniref:phospholipase C n=1 Tax=Haladaptatus sp. AB643 TaxID=2934174 RepID=UPI00209BBE02|nr:alkaline phosphatase family protein [Haladaptatus sp. AB643]MCO8245324.1 alkaline phosphatase family protein [Haladaptatus sp. AB643]